MARRKTITREHILTATYEVISEEGFAGFTARNIASKMRTSTQPIYLEFKNMDDLRRTFLKEIELHLKAEFFNREITGDPITDLVLNYIDFSKKEKMLFKALFLDDHEDGEMLTDFILEIFMERAVDKKEYKNMNAEELRTAFLAIWVVAIGLASLTVSGRIEAKDDEIIGIINRVNENLKESPTINLTLK